MLVTLSLVAVLSVLCNVPLYFMLRDPQRAEFRSALRGMLIPDVIDVPLENEDTWRGMT